MAVSLSVFACCRSRRIAAARSSSVTTCRASHQKASLPGSLLHKRVGEVSTLARYLVRETGVASGGMCHCVGVASWGLGLPG